jgi:peroxiredoxin-like protein
MATMHPYTVTVNWKGGRDGSGNFAAEHSGASLPIAVPPEFQGPGGATNPEELLTSAIASCYSITLGIVAGMRKLPMTNVETKAVGQVEQAGPNFTYKSITLYPTITLASDATDEHVALAEDLSHKADAYCIITNAVRGKVEIAVEPTIVRG